MSAASQQGSPQPLSRFTQPELDLLRQCGTSTRLEPGDLLFQRGDPGDSMFLLEEGRLRLIFTGNKPDKEVGPNTVFGELAFLIGDHARTATVQAVTGARLMQLDQGTVARLVQEQPDVLFHLLRKTTRYLLQSEQELIGTLQARNQELQLTLDYLRRTREELDYQELLARTDALTGLYNRRCLDAQLTKAMDRFTATGVPAALILLDLDGFKPINDSYGHPAGDTVLRQVAAVLTRVVRQSDFACRIGGDEFALLLLDAEETSARTRAETVCREVAQLPPPVEQVENALRVSVSVGGTLARPGDTGASLMSRADQALYQAKAEGKACVHWEG